MASNPVTLQLPPFGQGMITCVSNAANWQRVTLVWGSTEIVFEGTGERAPMKYQGGLDTIYKLPGTAEATTMTALFEYSAEGSGGPFSNAVTQNPTVMGDDTYALIEATSEDGSDSDNNDSYLSVMLLKPLPAVADETVPEPPRDDALAAPQAVVAVDTTLLVHAKTYYNNPNIGGGDEHYVTVVYRTGPSGPVTYSSTGWHMTNGSWSDRTTPFGGFLTVYVEASGCTYPGMEFATIQLTTVIPYWFTRPTGIYPSPDWQASMHRSQYTITSVTP